MKLTDSEWRWNKRVGAALALVMLLALLCGCAGGGATEPLPTAAPAEAESITEAPRSDDPQREDTDMKMRIDGVPVTVRWEDNESVSALEDIVRGSDLIITASGYGGFEQVGPIGQSLPRSDAQTTTQAGDIVLYSGNQIVIFYGSNSWAYTRLGRITDKTPEELAKMLSGKTVSITLYFD